MTRLHVVCLPGGVAPAAQRYAPLKAMVGDDAELHLKDLEVYRDPTPSAGYSVDLELDAIDAFADSMGLERFHLLGYSGGGFISLAYTGTRPQRVKSLAVFEPASIPGPLSPDEAQAWNALMQKLSGLEGQAFMSTFVREQLKPGVEPPPTPAGPPSPEMQKRPAGIAALVQAFQAYPFDRKRLSEVPAPLFFGFGDQTSDVESIRAGLLARTFADSHVRRFAGVHHFVPPEMIYTRDHVDALLEVWRRSENSGA